MKNQKQNSVASDSIFLAFAKVVTTLLSLVTTRIICDLLSQTEYGTYSQILLLVSTISSITILGMSDALNYYYNKYREEKKAKEYVATIFFMQIFVSVLVFIFILGFTPVIISWFKNPKLEELIIFAGILPLMLNLLSMLQVLFISVGKAKQIAFRNFIISLINLILFSIGSYLVREVYVLLIFTVILDGMQIVYFVVSLIKSGLILSIKNIRISFVYDILKYCVPMAMSILTNSLSRDLDKYVISLFTDTKTMALYTNAAKILPFDILMTSFVTVLIPVLTREIGNKNFKVAQNIYNYFIMFSCITTMILATGVIPVASEAMCFLYSEKYVRGYPIFIVYILIDIIRFMSLSLVLSASGKSKLLMKISIGSLLANLLLSIVMYRIIGIIGPAIATFIIMLFVGIITLHFSAEAMKTKIKYILDIKKLFKGMCLIFVICLIEYAIKLRIQSFTSNYFIVLCLSYGFYFIVTILLFRKTIVDYYKKLNNI